MTRTYLIPALASVLVPCVAFAAAPVLRLDGTLDPAVLAMPAGTELRLETPDGRRYPLEVQAPRLHPSGNATWRARIVGQDRDGFVVTLTGDATSGLFGTALTPHGEFRVVSRPERWNEIHASAADLEPYRGLYDTTRPSDAVLGSPMDPVRSREDHATDTVIRVTVYYTPSARAGRDGPAWQAYLDDLFAVANEAHEQSGTMVRLERVSDLSVGLSETASNADMLAQLPTVATEDQRALHDAHLLTLLRGWQASHASCGHVLVPVCGNDEDCYDSFSGYSVVSVGGACPTLELAHQTGHNLGSAHEPADSQIGTFPFSRAHVTAGGTGTVMSVGAGNQVARFSSPALATDCGGDPCGVADVSDNVRSIEITRHFLARWLDERDIGLVGTDIELEQGITNSNTVDIERFGIVGGSHFVSLRRNGEVVIEDLGSVTYRDDSLTFKVPFSVPVSSGYVVRFTSTVRPSVFFDTPVTVVEPRPATVFEFTETLVSAPGTGRSVTLTVARTGVLTGAAQVRYQTTGGSASGNFTPADGILSWGPGEGGTKTFTVNNVRSSDSGQVTSLFVVLSDPSPGARVGADFRVEVRVAGRPGGGGGNLGPWTVLFLAIVVLAGARRRI